MGRIPQEIIDQILDRTDIAEVISGYIQIKKAGRSFKANCPFHNEKTPSFVISPDKQIYHCFGCGVGGNAINFVMTYENMEFPEAVRILADKAGVEVPSYDANRSEGPSLSSRLYEVNDMAAEFYEKVLRSPAGAKALEYLTKRGISGEILKQFRIGYAPDEWEALRKYSLSRKVSDDMLRKAGLSIPSEKGKNDYDRFRGRITFPIFNERGSIVGFGGRVLDASLPKYINSPETVVYSKSNILYGLNFSRKGIRENSHVLIVEGYMDVIMPFQYGLNNLVAASGTALTAHQASMLKKYTDTAVMIFDSDQAGEAAALRGLDILIENGINVRIVTLPQGDDPDTFLRKNGKEKFAEIVELAKGLFDYKLDLMIKRLGQRDIGGIVDEMLPTISRISNEVVKSDYLRRLAERLGIHEGSVRHEMSKVKSDYSYHFSSEEKAPRSPASYRSSELYLLGLAVSSKGMFERIEKELGLDNFRDKDVAQVFVAAGDLYRNGTEEITPGKLVSRLKNDERAREALMQAMAKAEITQDHGKALEDCIMCVRKETRDEVLKDLNSRLKEAQEKKDNAEITKLVARISKIHKEKVA